MNNLGAPGDSGQPKNYSAATDRTWDLWVRTVTVLTLAYPDAKLTDEEMTARTAMYCESLTPAWQSEEIIRAAMAKGRLVWKFFPTIAEINSALVREADRRIRDATPSARDRHFAQLAVEDQRPREPMTEAQIAEIERVKLHLANRSTESKRRPPVPPSMTEARIRDRSRVTAGASPEWHDLMAQPIP